MKLQSQILAQSRTFLCFTFLTLSLGIFLADLFAQVNPQREQSFLELKDRFSAYEELTIEAFNHFQVVFFSTLRGQNDAEAFLLLMDRYLLRMHDILEHLQQTRGTTLLHEKKYSLEVRC